MGRPETVDAPVGVSPPVIYSVDARAKLVFLVEAWPDPGTTLHPGQPVDVNPLPAGSAVRTAAAAEGG